MSKHTPGRATPAPWTDDATLNHYTTRVIRHNGIVVARLPTAPQDPDNMAELEANASLIAAAPEMLEALKRTLRFAIGFACEARDLAWPNEDALIPNELEEAAWIIQARAAIARAEGRDTP